MTHQEKRAAECWVNGVDIDGKQTKTKKEIAKACCMTEQQVYDLFKREEFLEEVDKRLAMLRQNSGRELLKAVPVAVDKLKDIIEHGEDREALQAARTLLSIAGFSEHKIFDVNVNDAAGVIRGGFGRRRIKDAELIEISDGDDDAGL